ncbi:nucleoside deaminase [Dongshaea marina]|uniref:nucleoside deaminase n=1 Tax=Dongshaea marina TaxID=2047966 RepID=UPI000D3EB70A|nr:nucleoside deaminase [Dongshaea marina]
MDNHELLGRMLAVIEGDVLPLTRKGVASGNKVFGAAILRKADLSLVVAATNAEMECPLWHGEIHAIKKFYELAERPGPEECIFLSTHDPCSMCISAICWGGFNELYYLFDFEDTRDAFHIPHDLKIMDELFGCRAPTRSNNFYRATKLAQLLETSEKEAGLQGRLDSLYRVYAELSDAYQQDKTASAIPLK